MLKHAPRVWYKKIIQYLYLYDYFSAYLDHSLFIKMKKNLFIIILLYVDGMIIISNDKILKLFSDVSFRFEIKVLEKLNIFLTLEVINI